MAPGSSADDRDLLDEGGRQRGLGTEKFARSADGGLGTRVAAAAAWKAASSSNSSLATPRNGGSPSGAAVACSCT